MDASRPTLRITTLNLLHDGIRNLEPSWARRRPEAITMVRRLAPDVLCLQEVSPRQLDDLRADLPEFEIVPGTPNGATWLTPWLVPLRPLARAWWGDYFDVGERCPILLRTEVLTRVADGTFPLQDRLPRSAIVATPHRVTWVRARVASTGSELTVHNTHLGLVPWRKMGTTRRLAAFLDQQWDGTPQFVTGDFNAEPDSNVLRHLRDGREDRPGFQDLWCEAEERVGSGSTYDTLPWLFGRPRIDFVLARPALRTVRAEVTDPVAGRIAPSDHRPVTVEVAFA